MEKIDTDNTGQIDSFPRVTSLLRMQAFFTVRHVFFYCRVVGLRESQSKPFNLNLLQDKL